MTAAAPLETSHGDPLLPRRPGWLLSVLLDGAFATIAYFGAYWLRFQGERLEAFLPGALSTVPFVVVGQLASLLAAGAYVRRPRLDWLFRVIVGIIAGTTFAAAARGLSMGFEGVSRSAFGAAAILMTVCAIGWRGAWVLRAREQMRTSLSVGDGDLVDRATAITTLRGMVKSLYVFRELLKNLVFKDLKLKYGDRCSVLSGPWRIHC